MCRCFQVRRDASFKVSIAHGVADPDATPEKKPSKKKRGSLSIKVALPSAGCLLICRATEWGICKHVQSRGGLPERGVRAHELLHRAALTDIVALRRYMHKSGSGVLSIWQKRYFRLEGMTLKYYNSIGEKSSPPAAEAPTRGRGAY